MQIVKFIMIPTLIFSLLNAEYCITNVAKNDVLNARENPDYRSKKSMEFLPDQCGIYILDVQKVKKQKWFQVVGNYGYHAKKRSVYNGFSAPWVNGKYLIESSILYPVLENDTNNEEEEHSANFTPKSNEKISADSIGFNGEKSAYRNVNMSQLGEDEVGHCDTMNMDDMILFYGKVKEFHYDLYETVNDVTHKTDEIVFFIQNPGDDGFEYRRRSLYYNKYLDENWIKVDKKQLTSKINSNYSPFFPVSDKCALYSYGWLTSAVTTPYMSFNANGQYIGDSTESIMVDVLPAVTAYIDIVEESKAKRYVLKDIVYNKNKKIALHWNAAKLEEQLTYEYVPWYYNVYNKKTKQSQDVFFYVKSEENKYFSIKYYDEISGMRKIKKVPLGSHNPLFPKMKGNVYLNKIYKGYYSNNTWNNPSIYSYMDEDGKKYDFIEGYEGLVARYEDSEKIYELMWFNAHIKVKRFFNKDWRKKR